MTPGLEMVAQFEPDFDGTWEAEVPAPVSDVDAPEEMAWIVWADAALESAWAASEVAADWLAAMRLTTTR